MVFRKLVEKFENFQLLLVGIGFSCLKAFSLVVVVVVVVAMLILLFVIGVVEDNDDDIVAFLLLLRPKLSSCLL